MFSSWGQNDVSAAAAASYSDVPVDIEGSVLLSPFNIIICSFLSEAVSHPAKLNQ